MFYSPQDKNVFVLINASFLKNNYFTNFKPRSKVILEELRVDVIVSQPARVVEIRKERTLQVLVKISHYVDIGRGM